MLKCNVFFFVNFNVTFILITYISFNFIYMYIYLWNTKRLYLHPSFGQIIGPDAHLYNIKRKQSCEYWLF